MIAQNVSHLTYWNTYSTEHHYDIFRKRSATQQLLREHYITLYCQLYALTQLTELEQRVDTMTEITKDATGRKRPGPRNISPVCPICIVHGTMV